MSWLDRWLNRTTMYRLTIDVLLVLLGIGGIYAVIGTLNFSIVALVVTAGILVGTCWLMNHLFARVFGAPVHSESAIITGLILSLIVSPTLHVQNLVNIFWIGVLAIAGKYILAWQRQHIFNPAALAVAITGATIGQSASWWIGNAALAIWALLGGYLILRKMQRILLASTFVGVAGVIALAEAMMRHAGMLTALRETFLVSPIIFFASVMLIEPITLPGRRPWRYMVAGVAGVLYAPQLHLGSVYSTPELTLLVANFFAFVTQARERYTLTLERIEEVGQGVRDYLFRSDRPIRFIPGQYAELTLRHPHSDNRGQRRYFTLASAPGENNIHFGVKFYETASTFKRALFHLQPGQQLVASQVGGDFILPKDQTQKLLFIAGGIGVTPFRSIVADLMQRQEHRDMTLLYSVARPGELAYLDLFNQASNVGLTTLPTVTNTPTPDGWTGLTGFINLEFLHQHVPDYQQRHAYISGPRSMVTYFQAVLRHAGVPASHVHVDFFPGFA